MKRYVPLIALAFFLMAGASAYGEDTQNTTATSRPVKTQEFKEKRDAAFQEIKEKRADFIEKTKEDRSALQEKRKEVVGNLKEDRAALEQKIKERREALKTEIQEIKKERVSIRKSFVEGRFDTIIKNIAAHQERVGKKIVELEGKGYDLDEAQDHLDESKAALEKAKGLLASLKASVVSDTNESTATKPREIAKQIEAELKSARTHLIESIKSIRAALEEKQDDSSSDTTSSDNQ